MANVVFDGKFFDDNDYLLKKYHLKPNDLVQETIDGDVVTYMRPYTPFKSGDLSSKANFTGIGTGVIVQDGPYAHYQYYGELYIDPLYKIGAFYSPKRGFWSRKDVRKIPSGKPLTYDKSYHPLAGPKWFERMKEAHKQDILKNASRVAKKGHL